MHWTNLQQHTTQQYSDATTTTTTTIQQKRKQQKKQYNNSDNKKHTTTAATATTATSNTTCCWPALSLTPTVNQNSLNFLKQKIDQSDSCIFSSMAAVSGMDECRHSQIVYTGDQAVLNIRSYKKIRVKWFFTYFMKMTGTKQVYKAIYIVVCNDFL